MGAISVDTPSARFSEDRRKLIIEQVVNAARQ
ncbi:MAG: hypothetical protein MUO64_12305 [Anaerolineales bacterium]|nr:hypothetical protein [Anaerolineales bacterium]